MSATADDMPLEGADDDVPVVSASPESQGRAVDAPGGVALLLSGEWRGSQKSRRRAGRVTLDCVPTVNEDAVVSSAAPADNGAVSLPSARSTGGGSHVSFAVPSASSRSSGSSVRRIVAGRAGSNRQALQQRGRGRGASSTTSLAFGRSVTTVPRRIPELSDEELFKGACPRCESKMQALTQKVVFYRAKYASLSDRVKILESRARADEGLGPHLENEEVRALRARCASLERALSTYRGTQFARGASFSSAAAEPMASEGALPPHAHPPWMPSGVVQHATNQGGLGPSESAPLVPRLHLSQPSARRPRHSSGDLTARSTEATAAALAREAVAAIQDSANAQGTEVVSHGAPCALEGMGSLGSARSTGSTPPGRFVAGSARVKRRSFNQGQAAPGSPGAGSRASGDEAHGVPHAHSRRNSTARPSPRLSLGMLSPRTGLDDSGGGDESVTHMLDAVNQNILQLRNHALGLLGGGTPAAASSGGTFGASANEVPAGGSCTTTAAASGGQLMVDALAIACADIADAGGELAPESPLCPSTPGDQLMIECSPNSGSRRGSVRSVSSLDSTFRNPPAMFTEMQELCNNWQQLQAVLERHEEQLNQKDTDIAELQAKLQQAEQRALAAERLGTSRPRARTDKAGDAQRPALQRARSPPRRGNMPPGDASAPSTSADTPGQLARGVLALAEKSSFNGQLSRASLVKSLGSSDSTGKRFRPFVEWLTANSARDRWSGADQNDTMTMSELQKAVAAFYNVPEGNDEDGSQIASPRGAWLSRAAAAQPAAQEETKARDFPQRCSASVVASLPSSSMSASAPAPLAPATLITTRGARSRSPQPVASLARPAVASMMDDHTLQGARTLGASASAPMALDARIFGSSASTTADPRVLGSSASVSLLSSAPPVQLAGAGSGGVFRGISQTAPVGEIAFPQVWRAPPPTTVATPALLRSSTADSCICGNSFMMDSIFCRMCGRRRPEVRCSCGTIFLPDSVYCIKCGQKRPEANAALQRSHSVPPRSMPVITRHWSADPRALPYFRSVTPIAATRQVTLPSGASPFAMLVGSPRPVLGMSHSARSVGVSSTTVDRLSLEGIRSAPASRSASPVRTSMPIGRSPSPPSLLRQFSQLRQEVDQMVKVCDLPPVTRDGSLVLRSQWRLVRGGMSASTTALPSVPTLLGSAAAPPFPAGIVTARSPPAGGSLDVPVAAFKAQANGSVVEPMAVLPTPSARGPFAEPVAHVQTAPQSGTVVEPVAVASTSNSLPGVP